MLHLNLPNATYLLDETLYVANGNNDPFQNNSRTLSCAFSGDMTYYLSVDGEHAAVLTIHSLQAVSSGGVDISCGVQGGPATYIYVTWRRMTAIRIGGTVSVQ